MSQEFFEKYRYKLKTTEELLEVVGSPPREKKMILCHGVFDVVHPGHVRHLAYAKTKADLLVVSVTADRHITKGIYRPHIPEGRRSVRGGRQRPWGARPALPHPRSMTAGMPLRESIFPRAWPR